MRSDPRYVPPAPRRSREWKRWQGVGQVALGLGVWSAVSLLAGLLLDPRVRVRRRPSWDLPPIRGAATIQGSATGGNVNNAAAWVGGVLPGAGDDVTLVATSGQITVNATTTWLTLDCTGYTSALTIGAAATLTIAGTKLLLVAGMTLTLNNATTSAVACTKTTAGTVLITSGGKVFGTFTTGTGTTSSATYQFQDAFSAGATTTFTHACGTLDTNGKAVSWGLFSSANTNTRTVTLGASAITITAAAGTPWNFVTATGLTFTPGTSSISFTGSGTYTLQAGAKTFATVAFSGAGSPTVAGGTYGVLSRAGTAVKTDTLIFSGAVTVSTLFVVTSQSLVNRVLVQSSTLGAQQQITAAALSFTNVVDFMDIKGAGAATWTTAGSGATSHGDCGGNTGITMTAAAAQTWSGNTTGSASTAANWTSRVPLPQDNVLISGLTSGTVTFDMPRIGASLDATGSTGGTISFSSVAVSLFGSLTFVSAITLTASQFVTFAGRGAQTITMATKTFSAQITFAGPGGTYTLQDNLTCFLPTHTDGTLALNGHSVTTTSSTSGLSSTSGRTRAINMGSGTWTVQCANGTGWNVSTAGMTFTAGTSTIAFTDTSATGKTFSGGGNTYNNLSITGGGAGAVTVTGANTFAVLTIGAPKTVILPSSTITTAGTLVALGSAGNLVTLQASTSGTAATLSLTNAPRGIDFLSVKDITATTNTLYAGSHSTDATGNTNVVFSTWLARTPTPAAQTQGLTIARSVARAPAVSQSQTLAVSRALARALAIAGAQTVSSSASTGRTVTVTQAQALARSSSTARGLAIGQAAASSRIVAITRSVVVAQSAVSGAQRSLGRAVSASQPQAVTTGRTVSRLLTVAQTSSSNSRRVVARVLTRSQAQTVVATRSITSGSVTLTHTIALSQVAGVSVARAASRRVTVSQAVAVAVSRPAIARHLTVSQAQTSTRRSVLARTVAISQPAASSRASGRSRFVTVTQPQASALGPRALTRRLAVSAGQGVVVNRRRMVGVTVAQASSSSCSRAVSLVVSVAQPQALAFAAAIPIRGTVAGIASSWGATGRAVGEPVGDRVL